MNNTTYFIYDEAKEDEKENLMSSRRRHIDSGAY
jgi:hypothetical protein